MKKKICLDCDGTGKQHALFCQGCSDGNVCQGWGSECEYVVCPQCEGTGIRKRHKQERDRLDERQETNS